MGYALKPSLSYCWIGAVPFFLDIEADRYFRLGNSAARAFAALVGGSIVSPEDLAALSASGILHRLKGPTAISAPPLLPQSISALSEPNGTPSVAMLTIALFDYVSAVLTLRFRGFFRAIQKLARKKRAQDRSVDAGTVAAVHEAYRTLDLLISSHGRCLPRSLAMAQTLLRYGGTFNIVLGVRSGPFGAHCWLQKGRTVLNDRLDNIRDFVPIFVL